MIDPWEDQLIRVVKFSPYGRGRAKYAGYPTFTLYLWDSNERDTDGKHRLAYELREHGRAYGKANTRLKRRDTTVVFKGDDFRCSPLHAVDSDETVKALMGFLTLRPGDTDKEYFDGYTLEQMNFALEHGEALSMEVYSRFGE